MQEKKLFKTKYVAKSNQEYAIKFPELVGHVVIQVFMDRALKANEYIWDRKLGLLILKVETGLSAGQTIIIEHFEEPSDPPEPRPNP